MKITRRVKEINQIDYFLLLDQFINDTAKGFRMRSNGKMIRSSTADNYDGVKRVLLEFSLKTSFELKLYLVGNLNKEENEMARRYSHQFYQALSNHLYEKGCFDNYVGHVFTIIKTFYNYLINERNINIGPFHKKFYIHKEDIPVIVFSPEQLNYLIYNKKLEQELSPALRTVKDIFIFGCTVALRACDLLNLKAHHLFVKDNEYQLNVVSSKTKIQTSIKLPDYALEILKKYEEKYTTLLPPISMSNFNRKLKKLASVIVEDTAMIKIRKRKGIEVMIYKDPVIRKHYQMSDHITSHTMRRTAITTMLRLGMNELTVRKISGHSPSSKEFYKYVSYTQKIINDETDKFFNKLMEVALPENAAEMNQMSLF